MIANPRRTCIHNRGSVHRLTGHARISFRQAVGGTERQNNRPQARWRHPARQRDGTTEEWRIVGRVLTPLVPSRSPEFGFKGKDPIWGSRRLRSSAKSNFAMMSPGMNPPNSRGNFLSTSFKSRSRHCFPVGPEHDHQEPYSRITRVGDCLDHSLRHIVRLLREPRDAEVSRHIALAALDNLRSQVPDEATEDRVF
jgi:hypothetical protein